MLIRVLLCHSCVTHRRRVVLVSSFLIPLVAFHLVGDHPVQSVGAMDVLETHPIAGGVMMHTDE